MVCTQNLLNPLLPHINKKYLHFSLYEKLNHLFLSHVFLGGCASRVVVVVGVSSFALSRTAVYGWSF